MAQSQNERILDEYAAAKNRRDVEGILNACHEECFYESKAFGPRIEGKAALKYFYEALFAWLPDYVGEFDGRALATDRAAVWGKFGGTLQGNFLGIEPTGKRIDLPVVFVVGFKDGLISGDTGYFDLATLCDQGGISIDQVHRATTMYEEVEIS